jgi:hypothetical protein
MDTGYYCIVKLLLELLVSNYSVNYLIKVSGNSWHKASLKR